MTRKLDKKISVYSSGIYANNNDKASYPAILCMKEYGVNLENHKACNINRFDLKEMDLILTATIAQKYELVYMYNNLKDKIFTMKEYAEEKDLDIKDPFRV